MKKESRLVHRALTDPRDRLRQRVQRMHQQRLHLRGGHGFVNQVRDDGGDVRLVEGEVTHDLVETGDVELRGAMSVQIRLERLSSSEEGCTKKDFKPCNVYAGL